MKLVNLVIAIVLLTINFQNGITIFKIHNSVIHSAIVMNFSGNITQSMLYSALTVTSNSVILMRMW